MQLALDVAQGAPKQGAQFAGAGGGAFVLAGVGVAALLRKKMFAFAAVALAQRDVVGFGGFYEHFAGTVVEAAVGGKADVFFLNGGVDVDALKLGGLDGVGVESGADGLLEQFLHASFSGAPAPATHAGGVKRCFVLKVAHAAQILPVGVLEPAFADAFIAEIVGVFEVVEGDHEPGIDGGAPVVVAPHGGE